MQIIKGMAALLLGLALAGCGGGGSDAGTPPFASGGASAPTGNPGPAPGGGISVVSSGVPSQKFMSISVGTYNLNWGVDGDTTTFTVRVADSAGNPVPEGTVVQFSTEGGQIQRSCQLSGSTAAGSTLSTCSVTFGTQNLRPLDGKVAVVAWLEGEEAYADLNGNGVYDSGEPFYDAGKIFRDDNHDDLYTANLDEINVGATVSAGQLGTGTSGCVGPATDFLNDLPLSVTQTCDGVWGKTLVRANVTVAVSNPNIDAISSGNVITVFSIWNGVAIAAPFGTKLEPVNVPSGCTVSVSPPVVPQNVVDPTGHLVTAVGTCGASVGVKVSFGGTYERVFSVTP